MRKGKRGQKIAPPPSRGTLRPKERLRQQAYAYRAARNFGEAKPLLEELYKLEPDNMPLALDLGETYMETEDFGAATALYAKLIEKDPKNISAVTNLGGSLIRQGKLNDARSILEYALQLDPKSIHARINLGSVLQASGERKANLDNALEAVQIDPGSSLAFNNLGSAFSDMAMFKEAKHAYETAVMLDSQQVDALINLAAVEARLGDSKASAEMYERVLKILPKEASQRADAIRFYAAFEYLKQGELQKGWDYYEGGFSPLVPANGARSPRRTFSVPRWDGKPLNGKTLLVWREQGLGDELLFYTCLHELKEMGGNIIVECDKRLVEVMARSFPEFTIRAEIFLPQQEGRSPHSDFDFHLPAGSLMRHFRPTLESFNRSGAYIKPAPAKVAKFQERLAPYKDDCRLVGICWRSGKLDPVRNLSYTMLDEWGEVLQTPGFRFVNLQYGECEAELKEAEEKYGIEILRWSDLNLRNDLDDIFALMNCLDAVASVQTAVLTMGGVAGLPTIGIKAGGWTSLGLKRKSPWFDEIYFVTGAEKVIEKFEDASALRLLRKMLPSSIELRKDKLLSEQIKEIPAQEYLLLLERIASEDALANRRNDGIDGVAAVLKQGLWSHYEKTRPVFEQVISTNIILRGLSADATRYELAMSVAKAAARQGDWEVFRKHLQLAEELNKEATKQELPEFAWRSFLDGEIEQAASFATLALDHFDPEKYATFQLPRVIAECGWYELAIELGGVLGHECRNARGIFSAIAESFVNAEDWDKAIQMFELESDQAKLSQTETISYLFALSRLLGGAEIYSKVLEIYNSSESKYAGLLSALSLMSVDKFGFDVCSKWCSDEKQLGRGNVNSMRFSLISKSICDGGVSCIANMEEDLNKSQLRSALLDLVVCDFGTSRQDAGLLKLSYLDKLKEDPPLLLGSLPKFLSSNIKSIEYEIRSFYRNSVGVWSNKNGFVSLKIILNNSSLDFKEDYFAQDRRRGRLRLTGWHKILLDRLSYENTLNDRAN